jgi:hypothetical protein
MEVIAKHGTEFFGGSSLDMIMYHLMENFFGDFNFPFEIELWGKKAEFKIDMRETLKPSFKKEYMDLSMLGEVHGKKNHKLPKPAYKEGF